MGRGIERAVAGSGRVTLVTGASSGIGNAAARLFAQRGDKVIVAARRLDRLERLVAEVRAAGGRATPLAVDLESPSVPEALVAQIVEEHGRLDVLVNNAGFGMQAAYEEAPWSETERMFRVNVLAPMALARAAIPHMRRQGRGSIVNVASVGGVVAHPLNVAYCASKHALVGFSNALRLELAGSGIHVVVLCPGATRTEFFEQAKRDIPFASFIEANMVPAEVVARVLVRASTGGRGLVFPTWGAYFLRWADRWLSPLSRYGNVRYRDGALADRAQSTDQR